MSSLGRGVSRRALLRGGAAAAAGMGALGGLAGCGSAFASGVAGTKLDPQTVTFWNLFGGGDGARLTTMLDNYQAKHGGAKSLEAATFAWGNPYYTKVSLATLGDKPPDVAVAHLTRAKNLANAGLLTKITPELLGVVGLKPEDFTDSVWKAGLINGTSYDIPLDTHPFVMHYNLDVCKKAGLLGSDGLLKPIHGEQEWTTALTAMKKATGAFGGAVATIADTSTSWRWFQTLYSQMKDSTPVLGEDGKRITMNDDNAVKTLTFIQAQTKSGLMPAQTDYAGSQTLMFTGKAAFYLQGVWEITTEQTAKIPFSMGLIPTIYDQPATQADSHTFILPRLNRDAGQTQRAMGFVKDLLSQSMIWAAGGHIPAYKPILDSPEYKKLEPQANYASAATVAKYDAPAWYSGSGSNFEVTIGSQIGLVQQGLSSPAAAVKNIRSALQAYANTPNPL